MAKKENQEVAKAEENAEVKEVKKTAKKSTKKVTEEPVAEAPVEETPKKAVKKTTKKVEEAPVEVVEEVKEPEKEAVAAPVVEDPVEVSVEQKLVALYTLQQVDSKIDEIRAYRGNLPLEIQDMEDEIAGLETRIANFKEESKKHQKDIADYKIKIKETEALIKKYEEQQNNVRNNREYDSLTKEIEYQTLDIQLSEKRIKEITAKDNDVAAKVEAAQQRLAELTSSLNEKKEELHSLVEGTEKEEEHCKELPLLFEIGRTGLENNVANGQHRSMCFQFSHPAELPEAKEQSENDHTKPPVKNRSLRRCCKALRHCQVGFACRCRRGESSRK
jgi:hypothetical protein